MPIGPLADFSIIPFPPSPCLTQTITQVIIINMYRVYTGPIITPDGNRFVALGCYKDGKWRALPDMVANLRKKIDWRNMTKTVEECAEQVTHKNGTFKVFGLQYYGECWSGPDGEKTYSQYGASKHCWNGVGGGKVNFVYTFV